MLAFVEYVIEVNVNRALEFLYVTLSELIDLFPNKTNCGVDGHYKHKK